MEKARTVPDSYPLTLNSLASGCNQKTSREPLMQLTEAESPGHPGRAARERHLVIESQRPTRHALGAQLRASAGRAQPSHRSAGPADAARPWYAAECPPLPSAGTALPTPRLGRSILRRAARAQRRQGRCRWSQLLPKAPGAREARWATCCAPALPLPSASASGSGSSATALTGARR